ncbi:MAG: Rrf2 family transcriptional regulator [Chitinophagales bacterium]|nr:Rrf2 family transcriptional regulator [Chitinophagales bacterium]
MFSQACKYAIRAVLYLAVNANEEKKIGGKEIALELEVPQHFLAKILQQLSKNNLISSVKGPSGGFFLSKKNKEATLEEVIKCIDGPDVFTSCILGLPVCSAETPCPLHVQAYAHREGLNHQLRNQAIGDLAKQIEKDSLIL